MPKNKSLEHVHTFLVDLDGTMYLGDRLLPGAKQFFNTALRTGRQVFFLSNNSSRTNAAYAARLRHMGLAARKEQVFTSGQATIRYLDNSLPSRRIHVVGTRSLKSEFRRAGFDIDAKQPDCVVLGFDDTLSYNKIRHACDLVRSGVLFVATNPDMNCPIDGGFLPDCGAMTEMIAASTGTRPKVIGKPSQEMVRFALEFAQAEPGTTAMLGDRLDTDVKMAKNAGMTTILMMNGGTSASELRKSRLRPDFVFENLKQLAAMLRSPRHVS